MIPEFTPEKISRLGKDEIFVFGSNLQGRHAGGAARVAQAIFGAIPGCGVGLQGQSYAIPTMQGGVETIRPYVDSFVEFARQHPELKFYVTRIGCGIAGFDDKQIAPLFDKAFDLGNVVLPETFWQIINHARQLASETSGMTFHVTPVKYYDEDVARMAKMSQDEKVEYAAKLKKAGRYLIAHDSPEVDEFVLATTREGHHKIAISECGFAIIAGSKLYTDQYVWGVDFGQNLLSVIPKSGCEKDYPYGQFIVLLEDGTVKELWSDTCVRPLSPESCFCDVATGCDGLVFALRKDGSVAVLYGERNPQVAAQVAQWTDIIQIDAGPQHVVGLKEDHTVVAAGKASACEPLRDWKNIAKIYVSKMNASYGKDNALTFGIDQPYGWLHVDGDTWPKGEEFWKRIRAQYNVTDVTEDGYCVWIRTSDGITRAITYYSPMNYQEELEFVRRHPRLRYYDTFGKTKVMVDADGEFRLLYDGREISWWTRPHTEHPTNG